MLSQYSFRIIYIVIAILSMTINGVVAEHSKIYHLYGKTMGNNYAISLVTHSLTPQQAFDLRNKIEHELDIVNSIMSTWRKDSEITKINLLDANEIISISEPLKNIINESLAIEKMTHGAFDITVAPLVKLWGFGPGNIPSKIPDQAEITEVKNYTGSHHFQLQDNHYSKKDRRVQIDLSGIAKGHGVDVVANTLEKNGYHNYLINIGGEIYAKGNKLDGSAWLITIEDPRKNTAINTKININGMAVATSGDYRNYFEAQGVRFPHVIDPKTGWASQTHIISATVITQKCATADAIATAAMVMGAQKAMAFATKHDIALMLIEEHFGNVKVHRSKAFTKFIQ